MSAFEGVLLLTQGLGESIQWSSTLPGAHHVWFNNSDAHQADELSDAQTQIMRHGATGRRLVLLTSSTVGKPLKDLLALRASGLHLGHYTHRTYEPPKWIHRFNHAYCWFGGHCITYNDLTKLDIIFVYSHQAFCLFPRAAPKMRWLPVTWSGTLGLPSMEHESDMLRRWVFGKRMHECSHIATVGYAARNWMGLVSALEETQHLAGVPSLHIVGPGECANLRMKRICLRALSKCQAMGVDRCRVIKERLSKADYIKEIASACFVALPIETSMKLGAGLTGASEAASLGKVIVAVDDRADLGESWGTQWSGYIEHGVNGLVLPSNSPADWHATLESFATNRSRWLSLEAGAQRHALAHFSLEAINASLFAPQAERLSVKCPLIQRKVLNHTAENADGKERRDRRATNQTANLGPHMVSVTGHAKHNGQRRKR